MRGGVTTISKAAIFFAAGFLPAAADMSSWAVLFATSSGASLSTSFTSASMPLPPEITIEGGEMGGLGFVR